MFLWTLLPLLALAPPALAADDLRRTPVVEAVQRATPAVVAIEVEVAPSNPFAASHVSAGSGVIIRADGVVLTNAHVVEGARAIRANLEDGTAYEAEVLALDADLDLAVLQLKGASGLPVVELADSDALMLGETAIAVGNPLGLGMTVSIGVVSSVEREVQLRQGIAQTFIQTDAAINPGNSGGALIDIHGRLIGVNTAIRADAEGIGFAIPVNRARKVADDLVHYGTVRGPWLGCDVTDIDRRRLRGTPLDEGAVLVTRVWPGSAAHRAGVEPGDLLFEIDGSRVRSRADLNARLADRAPGDSLRARWVHDGAVASSTLRTTDLPATTGEQSLTGIVGIEVEPSSKGLLVTAARVDGSWAKARLRAGDLILGADGRRLRTLDDLLQAIQRARAQHRPQVLFAVQRGRYQGYMAVEI
jgi:S1-C subfamily serine protease